MPNLGRKPGEASYDARETNSEPFFHAYTLETLKEAPRSLKWPLCSNFDCAVLIKAAGIAKPTQFKSNDSCPHPYDTG